MQGPLLTTEKGPKGGGKFQGEPLSCPECLTKPCHYFFKGCEISGGVVQLVRTPACHAGGREFESRRPRQCYKML
jgi:hypothetical protein